MLPIRLFFALLSLLIPNDLSIFSFGPTTPPPKRHGQFYEIQAFRFKTDAQKKIIEDYFRDAAIPAFNRHGSSPIGVFYEADQNEGHKIYLLIPYQSTEQLVQTPSKLTEDTAYMRIAEPYFKANRSTQRAFESIETSTMETYDEWPVLKVPVTTVPKAKRVYEYCIYNGKKADPEAITVFFRAGQVNIFKRLGFNIMYFAETVTGSLVYMTSFESIESRDSLWKAFNNDASWNRMNVLPEYQSVLNSAEIHYLIPADYSQI